jgi:hypothetical protein
VHAGQRARAQNLEMQPAPILPQAPSAPTKTVSSAPLGSFQGEDPVFCLQALLGELPLPNPTRAETHAALLALWRFDQGQSRELSGLSAGLDFLRDPYANDEPLGDWDRPDTELPNAIAAAVTWVACNGDPEDLMTSLEGVCGTMPQSPKPDQRQRGADGPQVVEMPARGRGDALKFHGGSQPPFDRFDQLLRENREFRRAWDHKLSHLPDQSTEAYDQVLVGIALQAGWSNQEVVDLVIAHRRRQPLELETPEPAYFLKLIERAKNDPAAAPGAQAVSGEDPERVQKLIAALNRALGISILKITKYGAVDGTYELTLVDGRKVDLGPAGNVLSHRLTKAGIADATTIVIAPFKQPAWDKICSAIFQCAGPAPIEDAAEQQEMSWWLRSCLANTSIIDVDERDRQALARALRDRAGSWAFQSHTGQLMIHLGGFMSAVHLRCGARPTWKECALRLRKLGFIPGDLEGKDSDGRPRLNIWRAPQGWQADG